CAAEDLGKDPETEIRDGRQLKEKWKDENGHEHDDTRERKEKEVSAEHTGYRSRSAYGWNNGIQIRQPVHETSDEPAKKIEKQKSDRSHSIFNVSIAYASAFRTVSRLAIVLEMLMADDGRFQSRR